MTNKMPIITRKAWCQNCKTLSERDFVPAEKPIEYVYNYFARCKVCDGIIPAAYIDEDWLAGDDGISVEIGCKSCGYSAILGSSRTPAGKDAHPFFYLPFNDDRSVMYFICPKTGVPTLKPTLRVMVGISPHDYIKFYSDTSGITFNDDNIDRLLYMVVKRDGHVTWGYA